MSGFLPHGCVKHNRMEGAFKLPPMPDCRGSDRNVEDGLHRERCVIPVGVSGSTLRVESRLPEEVLRNACRWLVRILAKPKTSAPNRHLKAGSRYPTAGKRGQGSLMGENTQISVYFACTRESEQKDFFRDVKGATLFGCSRRIQCRGSGREEFIDVQSRRPRSQSSIFAPAYPNIFMPGLGARPSAAAR